MKKLLNALFVSIFVLFVAAPVATTAFPVQVSAAEAPNPACNATFLGIPAWYRGLAAGTDCHIIGPDASDPNGLSNYIWRIVLNGIEIALVIGAYIAIAFIIYGGFLFLTGGGNPAQVEKGRKSVLNAVIGLVITMGSIAITNFIFSIIGTASTTANGVPTVTDTQLLTNGLNITYFILGVIAVIVIIVSGINYASSGGDAGKVTKAKNMLTYAIVGLVIVLVAFSITNFVIGRF